MTALRLQLAALLLSAVASRADVASLDVWQQLPVQHEGRIMPLDSYARQTLLGLSGRSSFGRQPATRWLARVMFTPEATRTDTVFLVDNPEVAQALGLPADGRHRYSFADLEPSLDDLSKLARTAWEMDEDARSGVEKELIRLHSNLHLYHALGLSLDFALPIEDVQVGDAQLRADLAGLGEEGTTYLDLARRREKLDALWREFRALPAETWTPYQQEVFRLVTLLTTWPRNREGLPPALFPLSGHDATTWVGPWDLLRFGVTGDVLEREIAALAAMARAYRGGRQVEFDMAARNLLVSVSKRAPEPQALAHVKLEVRYNRWDAFLVAEMLYGFAFLATLASIAFRARALHVAALLLLGAALLPHGWGIGARMAIMGRPPVTNLYATFVFVAFVCAALGLATEYFQRNRLGLLAASAAGLILLMTAGRFAAEGDTMGVMMAVLDSNFWLSTHVVCITIGYAGCCMAGLVGHVYLARALFRPPGDPVLMETDQAIYGTLAFGLIFAFLGTMLGGIWADQSWGRFWGWDPKENGALLIVLWSAVLFHARLGRMIGPLGFAAGSVLGVICVLMAWMGINLLGVGLHSYGFTSQLAWTMAIACTVEVAFVAVTVPLARRAAARRAAQTAGATGGV